MSGSMDEEEKTMSGNAMNDKKTYIWKLAEFLCKQGKKMSGQELADHLNRNNFLTSYGTAYAGGRGTYKLVCQTYRWLNEDLGLPEEAAFIAEAYVKKDGKTPYKDDPEEGAEEA